MQHLLDPLELSIEARNKYFDSLSKRERAVLVAKDALLQLQLGTFALTSTYFLPRNSDGITRVEDDMSVQAFLTTPGNTCIGCAIGAAFASVVRLGNRCNGSELVKMGYIDTLLKQGMRAFTRRELNMMEYLFEGYWPSATNMGDSRFTAEEKVEASKYFDVNCYRIDKYERFRNIMNSIIATDGLLLVPGIRLSSTKKNKN